MRLPVSKLPLEVKSKYISEYNKRVINQGTQDVGVTDSADSFLR